MITCDRCGRLMLDKLDGCSGPEQRDLEAQISSRERYAMCFRSYEDTASLCRWFLSTPPTAIDAQALATSLRRRIDHDARVGISHPGRWW